MYVIDVRNVNDALPQAISLLQHHGKKVVSRGMETVEMPGPVSTVYHNPTQRVLFDPVRDANPFFHLMESLWIIGGSNRVELPKYFMDSIDRFSDDGKTFHGAYGHRLRHAFGFDQLTAAISILRDKPDSRQVVLSIWDGREDLGTVTKDLPCNDLIMLKVRDGKLNMTVCNRSNDAIWGAYGANVVQFSMLQEWLAASIGVNVGHYVQQSDSFHVYTDNPFWKNACNDVHWIKTADDMYAFAEVQSYALATNTLDALIFRKDCEMLCHMAEEQNGDLLAYQYDSTYFKDVITPAIAAYMYYKDKMWAHAHIAVDNIKASDWRVAMKQWIQRRQDKAAAKEQA